MTLQWKTATVAFLAGAAVMVFGLMVAEALSARPTPADAARGQRVVHYVGDPNDPGLDAAVHALYLSRQDTGRQPAAVAPPPATPSQPSVAQEQVAESEQVKPGQAEEQKEEREDAPAVAAPATRQVIPAGSLARSPTWMAEFRVEACVGLTLGPQHERFNLSGSANPAHQCADSCYEQGYRFFGLLDTLCWCDDKLTEQTAAGVRECSLPCFLNQTPRDQCGWRKGISIVFRITTPPREVAENPLSRGG